MNKNAMRRVFAPGVYCAALMLTTACGGTPSSGATDVAAGREPLELQGEAMAIDTGLVEVTAGRQVWQGEVSKGRFAMRITPAGDEVVLLKALGTGHQARVVLASLLGTGEELRAQAGDAVLNTTEAGTLKLSPLSTAKFGQLPTAELNAANIDAARRSVNLLEAYQVAAALQVLISDASKPMPQGFDNTLQLASSGMVRTAYAQSLRKTPAYVSASSDVGAGQIKPAQVTEAALLGTVSLASAAGNFSGVSVTFKSGGVAEIFDGAPGFQATSLATDSEGNYLGGFGLGSAKVGGTWAVDSDDGAIHVLAGEEVFSDTAVFDFGTPCAMDPSNDNGVSCLTRRTLKELVIRLNTGAYGRFLASVDTVTETSYPTVAAAAPVIATATDFVVVTLPNGYYKFSNSELADRVALLSVYDQSGAATDYGLTRSPVPALNAEVVNLNADGTGSVPRLAGLGLRWSLQDDDRMLAVRYSNGDTVSYRKAAREKPQPYSFNGDAFTGDRLNDLRDLFNVLGFGAQEFQMMAVHADSSSGLEFVDRQVFSTGAAVARFTDANVPGRYNQFGLGAETKDPYGNFVLDLLADHTGLQTTIYVCNIDDPDFADNGCSFDGEVISFSGTLRLFWSVNTDGQLVMERRRYFDAGNRAVAGAASRNCDPVGSKDAAGNTCKAVDRRVETLLKQHGSRYVVLEARSLDGFRGTGAPIDGIKPYNLARLYDRTAITK